MAPVVFIEFETASVIVNENDGSVTVNLVRTGNQSDDISVCINVIMNVDPDIAQRMCTTQCILIHDIHTCMLYTYNYMMWPEIKTKVKFDKSTSKFLVKYNEGHKLILMFPGIDGY